MDLSCEECNAFLPLHLRNISCVVCEKYFHIKCTNLKSKNHFVTLSNNGTPWICHICLPPPAPIRKVKCGRCRKTVPRNNIGINCNSCHKDFHSHCSGISFQKYSEMPNWYCDGCTISVLPFSNLNNSDLGLTLHGKEIPSRENLSMFPSFTIQSLLDRIPGNITIQTDDFLSDSIESKYYTPDEFLSSKINKNCFSIFHLNIASLSCHMDDLKTLLSLLDHPFNIIGITETKIRDDHETISNINLDNYYFENVPTSSHFGGAAIFVRKDHSYELKPHLTRSEHLVAESIFLDISLPNNKKILVGCVYRHHTSIKGFVDDFLVNILTKIHLENNKSCFIMGDFNVDLLNIDNDNDSGNFFDILSSHGFRPLILQPSRITSHSATLIDNIFTNDITLRSKGGNITASISDHFPQFSYFDISCNTKHSDVPKFGRSYKNFRNEEFQEELGRIEWNSLFKDKTVNDQVKIFLDKINVILDIMAPIRKLSKRENKLKLNPWITKGLLKSMSDRDKLYKQFIKETDANKKQDLFITFKKKRNLIITLLRRSKSNYFAAFFEEHKNNAKRTWEGIRDIVNLSKKNKTCPNTLIFNNKTFLKKDDMAEAFNSFFVNIGSNIDNKIPQGSQHFSTFLKNISPNSIFLTSVDNEEVLSMLQKLNSSKSCGPSSIPTNMLKTNALLLCEPLKLIINKSFSEGKFPDLLKIANVCPIYKKGDRNRCENYRPISLLSNLSKLFERAMHSRLYSFLSTNKSLYDLQFGFRQKFSTNHALLSITEKIRESLDNKTFSCGVFVDLEKAFDTVNHAILLKKLENYGVRGLANSWFASYLSSRKQMVVFDGSSSPLLDISCGVPQGSILGPLLFLIYINDMHSAIKHSTVYHFADDTNLLYHHKNPKILRKHMNSDLKLLFNWLCANRLSLNVSKTEFIIFRPPKAKLTNRITLTLNRTTIFESTKIKYLGIILDNRLSWRHHIFELSKKLNRSVGMLFKLRRLKCPTHILLSLYFAIFQSHLTYGICVWGCAEQSVLEKICLSQKRAIRAVAGLDYGESTKTAFRELKVLKIKDLYKFHFASVMWDQDHGNLPFCLSNIFRQVSDIHNYDTRSSAVHNLSENVIINTKTHGESMLKFLGPKILNELKTHDFYNQSKTKKTFQAKYKSFLLSSY